MLIVTVSKGEGERRERRWLVDIGLAKYSILEPIELLDFRPVTTDGTWLFEKVPHLVFILCIPCSRSAHGEARDDALLQLTISHVDVSS